MATLETTTKVSYVGVWREDTFTDEIVRNIAGHAQAEKGKKVKATVGPEGLRLKRTKWLKESVTEHFPLAHIKTVTRNPRFGQCVMFVMTDPKRKYKILALRCASDRDAIYLTGRFTQVRQGLHVPSNVELKKRDNGNWTLRDRSAHNANRHMAELFGEQQRDAIQGVNSNGGIPANGDVNHVPVLDRSKAQTGSNLYVKRNGTTTINNNNNNKMNGNGIVMSSNGEVSTYVPSYQPKVDKNEDDVPYIETQVISDDQPANEKEVRELKGELQSLSADMNEIKTILASKDYTDNGRGPSAVSVNNRQSYPSGQTLLPSRPVIYTARTTSSGTFQPTVYRAPARTYEARLIPGTAPMSNTWAPHRRVSGEFILHPKVDQHFHSGTESGRSSLRVKFDTESLKSSSSQRKSKSLRLRPDLHMATTIPRSIEDTYGRPAVIRRRVSAPGPRPASVHVVGGNELKIYQSYMDIAL